MRPAPGLLSPTTSFGMKKLLIVVGTRPNFIKVTRFKEVAVRRGTIDVRIVHTGQHFSANMADVFFEQFGLEPDSWLEIGQGSPNTQMAAVMRELEPVIAREQPDMLMVVGDVNSTMAAAITANKMGVRIGHLESGLRSFDRTMPEEFNRIVADELSVRAGTVYGKSISDRRLALDLDVSIAKASSDHYRVIGEVWGTSRDGKRAVPVAWIGGMSEVDQGRLPLSLDARWIAKAHAVGPFTLRNLRIEDPNHFIPLAKIASLPVDLGALPKAAFERTVSVDDEMLQGPRPLNANLGKGVGTRLLLVHGYCSGDAWGPVASQFSNASVFKDFNQNRSHDQFANLIKNFGATWNSFGVVAHSQGGAASLHLYTYYWSGLDYATGARLIQSVGTPYQGTALAGNAAVLGSVFGIGCGTNTNLTYSGAASWLAGIPTTRRAKVNYYTTSFTDRSWVYDYCNMATDVLLSDPEDGTTEKAYGQLSGAVNQGHKTGWCHTSGMRDPAQVTDSSRNSTMNANAAR